MNKVHDTPSLSTKEISENVYQRLEKYKKLNLLEQFSMFIGMTQILELILKQLLVRKYKYNFDKLEKFTLGRLTKELKKSGLREDFISLLENVVDYRNYVAHEFIANEMMLSAILQGQSSKLEIRHFQKGVFELEQLLFLYEWNEENGGWE